MRNLPEVVTTLRTRFGETLRSLRVLRRAGLVPIPRLDIGLRSLVLTRRYGPLAGGVRTAAHRDPTAIGLVDERGRLTFAALDRQSNALARAWAHRGLGQNSVLAVLCRDHRGLVLTLLAAGKLGVSVLLLNTGFGAPQLAEVAAREKVDVLVYDEEFSELVSGITGVDRYLAWTDTDDTHTGNSAQQPDRIDDMILHTGDVQPPAPTHPGGIVLLTSGTTGTPKGAPRPKISPLDSAQFLDRIPLRAGEASYVASPLFHATGFSQLILACALGSTVVLRRQFDPEATLRGIAEQRCSALVLVPTMLQRLVDLDPEVRARYDTSCLRIIFVAGSALSPDLGNRVTEIFGDVLHNLYGSTEVAVATVATPQDWRAAPGTAGCPPVGCRVALYDDHGLRIEQPRVTGRVFVGSGLAFAGYTDGGNKDVIDGLLSTGDVGHFDSSGRLFIDGRDDEMIVSGGENVYPLEVENLLDGHPDVVEAAVIGVPDAEFGQRLKAFIVRNAHGEDVLDAEAVREYVKRNLARYKVPRDVTFLDALPRNTTGKVLRTALS